jgi:XTP/dITP diphosphohydrolase/tetrapyrrole methylase family protein/MazG family protein/ATP diphosphatase
VATEHRAPTDHERSSGLVAALARLDELAKHLRRECPWDAEQDERSIVPHTVEEAYELADAAQSGDDAKLLDELGDVLYQVYFLSLLLEERDAGDLAAVADNTREKLIRRHPHVFGETVARDAAEAIRSWGAAKRDLERGGDVFGEIPETLPGPLYALKMQKRLDNAGLRERTADEALGDVERLAGELRGKPSSREERFSAVGELLFAAVDAARALEVDPELALRDAAERFRQDHES